jgi:hypothetical protein
MAGMREVGEAGHWPAAVPLWQSFKEEKRN